MNQAPWPAPLFLAASPWPRPTCQSSRSGPVSGMAPTRRTRPRLSSREITSPQRRRPVGRARSAEMSEQIATIDQRGGHGTDRHHPSVVDRAHSRDGKQLPRGCGEQCGHALQSGGHEPVVDLRATPLRVDDPCFAEDLQVVADGGLGQVERRGQLADAHLTLLMRAADLHRGLPTGIANRLRSRPPSAVVRCTPAHIRQI
jgi:hypothetical protein